MWVVGWGFRLRGWQQSPVGPGELPAHRRHCTSGWEGATQTRTAVKITGTIAVRICHDCCHDHRNDYMTAVTSNAASQSAGVQTVAFVDGGKMMVEGSAEGVKVREKVPNPPTCPPLQSHVPIWSRIQTWREI